VRLEWRGLELVIVLSERNVRALYHKLTMPDSKRTLIAPENQFTVTIEDDETHYKDRAPAGVMHPLTEEAIK
jgi:hypothetical protein